MKKFAIVFGFGLAAACGGIDTSATNSGGGGGGGGGGTGGGGGNGTFVMSCITPGSDGKQKQCDELYSGTVPADEIGNIKSVFCKSSLTGETPSTSPCDRANTVGSCQAAPYGLSNAVTTSWYYSPYTADGLKPVCETMKGTWMNP